jgi:hypothetical protein
LRDFERVVDPSRVAPLAVLALHHFEGFDPGLDGRASVFDVLAHLADQRLGLVEVGAQLTDARVALL